MVRVDGMHTATHGVYAVLAACRYAVGTWHVVHDDALLAFDRMVDGISKSKTTCFSWH